MLCVEITEKQFIKEERISCWYTMHTAAGRSGCSNSLFIYTSAATIRQNQKIFGSPPLSYPHTHIYDSTKKKKPAQIIKSIQMMKKFMIEIKLSPDVTSSSSVESALSSSISGVDISSLTKTTDRMTNQIILSVSFSTSSSTFDIYDLQDNIEELSDDIDDVEISPVLSVEISEAPSTSPITDAAPIESIQAIKTSATNKRRRKRKAQKSSSPKSSSPKKKSPVRPTLTKKQLRANRALSSITLRDYLSSLSAHLVDTITIPPASWGSTPPRLADVTLENQPATFPSSKPLKLTGNLHSGTSTRSFDDFQDEYEWISSADPSKVLCQTQVYVPQFSDIGHTLTCRARIHPCASKSQQKLRSTVVSKKDDSSSDYLKCEVTMSVRYVLSLIYIYITFTHENHRVP